MKPIRIGEGIPRIIGTSVTSRWGSDINAGSFLQLCIGIKAWCEKAVHVHMFKNEKNHGILQIEISKCLQ